MTNTFLTFENTKNIKEYPKKYNIILHIFKNKKNKEWICEPILP